MKLTARMLIILVAALMLTNAAWTDVGGRITGTVKDQTNGVIPGATVTAINTATGVKQTTTSDAQGSYTFPVLPVGQYEIDVAAGGFKANRTQGLVINVGAALTVDITLELSSQNETVAVTENAAQVETSDTQLGEVIGSKQVTSIPLNGRSYTDLFAMQVGVTPLTTSGAGNSTSHREGVSGQFQLRATSIPGNSQSTDSANLPMDSL